MSAAGTRKEMININVISLDFVIRSKNEHGVYVRTEFDIFKCKTPDEKENECTIFLMRLWKNNLQ